MLATSARKSQRRARDRAIGTPDHMHDATGAAKAAAIAPSTSTPPRQGANSLRPPYREPVPAAKTTASSFMFLSSLSFA